MPDDTIDPCVEAARLRAIRTTLATGGGTKRVKFGDDEVEYYQGDTESLDRLIEKYEQECLIASGNTQKRVRFAKSVRFCR